MALRALLRPEARVDLEQAAYWYEDQRQGLGDRFTFEVLGLLQQIGGSPLLFPEVFRHSPARTTFQPQEGTMKRLVLLAGLVFVLAGCSQNNGGAARQGKEINCRDISVPAIKNANGTLKLCVTATQCREDEMAKLISASYCADPSREAAAKCGNGTCDSGQCVGVLVNTGMVVTNCKWDRDNPCASPAGTNPCTCDWSIPPGASLQCGCGCK